MISTSLIVSGVVSIAFIVTILLLGAYRLLQERKIRSSSDHQIERTRAAHQQTLTIIVPAHNEEAGVGETLESFLAQTVPAERIIVVADNCDDRTAEIAASYPGVEVLVTPDGSGGSKAKAQNYALQFVETDLVLPVDADTTLDADYLELVKPVLNDPRVAIAAGFVLPKRFDSVWERGRLIEYLFGFTFHRPIQNLCGAPMVCSGCCSIFETKTLQEFGGFPERTIVEDMDYTWSQQIAGRKAKFVSAATARAADPNKLIFLRKQMWRWESGFFQNVRIHSKELLKHKKVLLGFVWQAVLEIVMAPLWYLMPLVPFLFGYSYWWAAVVFFGSELVIGMPVLTVGAYRKGVSIKLVVKSWPCLYANRCVNLLSAWGAFITEMILVPLRLRKTFLTYEMGR